MKDYSELMNVCDSQFGSCGASTTVGSACSMIFTEPGGFDTDYLKSSRCAPIADAGAHKTGASDTPAQKSGGCSYRER